MGKATAKSHQATFVDRPRSPDYMKYTRRLQKGALKRPLEKRGELYFHPVLEEFVTNPVKIRRIQLIAADRCLATQKLHNRVLTKLQLYCERVHKTNIMLINDDILLDYLLLCEDMKVKQSYFSGLHGAIQFLTAACKIQDPWDKAVARAYGALFKRTACEKPAIHKAEMLPLNVLQKAIERFILANERNPHYITLPEFRGLILQLLQVKLLARVSDLRKLRAVDFTCTMLGNTRVISVKFRTAKNDPRYLIHVIIS